MSTRKMHADEVDTDPSLVGRLIASQFPEWADLPIQPVPSAGTDNALYRLGHELVVRLPRIHWAVGQVEKEHEWLPRLARQLPLRVPIALAKGMPAFGYPWEWAVHRWLEGENATRQRLTDLSQAALDLAAFVAALQRVDPDGGPPPGQHNSFRGVPLATRDGETRVALASLDGSIDVGAATATWEGAVAAPEWADPPVWIHGDLQSGNLLAVQGRLSAVIDFGCLGVGDPACDVMVAWTLFSGDARDAFRAALAVDDATWARSRGWALSFGLIALPYYQDTNPLLAGIARTAIDEVLADHAASG